MQTHARAYNVTIFNLNLKMPCSESFKVVILTQDGNLLQCTQVKNVRTNEPNFKCLLLIK